MATQWGCDCIMALLPAIASPMHGAVVPIAYVNLSSPGINITFSNIPQTYQDLMLVAFARNTQAVTINGMNLYINTTSQSPNYWSQTTLTGNGSSVASTRGTTTTIEYGATLDMPGSTSTSGVYGSVVYHILNYTNTTTYKTVLGRNANDQNGSGSVQLAAALFSQTAAVTTLQIGAGYGANYSAGTTFALYGVRTVNQ